MTRVLMASPPIFGHLTAVLAVARGLVDRGCTVDILTGAKYRADVERTGGRFLPLPAEVDYDDADLDAFLPGRDAYEGIAAMRHDLIGMFARVVPGQSRALAAALDTAHYDAVIADIGFGGAVPVLLTRAERPPVFGLSSVPLTMASVDTAPFGLGLPPLPGPIGQLRNRFLTWLLTGVVLRDVEAALDTALREGGVTGPHPRFLDTAAAFDAVFQLTTEGIEYPRRELGERVEFVGPMAAAPRPDASMPEGWHALDSDAPIVHVTQGTIDNRDLTRLIIPTIRALADAPVTVVASTGGQDPAAVRAAFPASLPANARVAEFLPYDVLLPRTAVMITNGGFGGVQQALRHGVPLVVAGATEDKPEVAARVAWAGAGVNLRSGSPSPARIRRGVERVLGTPAYAARARELSAEIARAGDPVERIAARVAAVAGAPAESR